MLRQLTFASLIALATLSAAEAQIVQPGSQWVGFQEMKGSVSGLGKSFASGSLELNIIDSRSFRAFDSVNGLTYTGTYSVKGKSYLIQFDSGSLARLADSYEDWIEAELANLGISTNVTVSITKFKAKAKAKETRNGRFMKVQMMVKFEASAPGFRPRKGKVKMKAVTQQTN